MTMEAFKSLPVAYSEYEEKSCFRRAAIGVLVLALPVPLVCIHFCDIREYSLVTYSHQTSSVISSRLIPSIVKRIGSITIT
jgi:hypothetical protein